MNKKKYYGTIITVYLIFISVLIFSGYFRIGLLSDDYNNLNDAVNSSLFQKLSGKLPLTNVLHFRPIYYLSIQFGYFFHNLLGLGYDNFVNFRIENLLLYLFFSYLCGRFVFLLSQKYFLSILTTFSILLFPSNIHNICWTAGRVDILCGIFYVLFIHFAFKYLDENKKSFLLISCFSMIAALLSKETAITALPICIIFVYFFKGKLSFKRNYELFSIQFLLLLFYLFYKLQISQFAIPEQIGENSSMVLIKSYLGLILPVDLLTIQYQLKQDDISILIYFALFTTFSFIYFLHLFQLNFFKTLLFTLLITLISTIPYSVAGYVRPQIILVPFSLLIIFTISTIFHSKNKMKFLFTKPLLISYLLILSTWVYSTFENISQWKFAYDYSRATLNNFINTQYDKNNYTIILGNPGRLGQSFMFDKLTGAYNYWRYKNTVVKDTLYDIVLTGGLNPDAINSRLEYKINSDNECAITSENENQFFYIEGFNISKDHNLFENDKVKIEFTEFSYINKPLKMNVLFKSKAVNCYLVNKMRYFKIF